MSSETTTLPSIKWIGAVIVSAVAAEGLYEAWQFYKRKCGNNRNLKPQCLFFPDKVVACRRHFTEMHGCNNGRCFFSHDSELAYAKLLRQVMRARQRLDVCVFVITCSDLADVIMNLHSRGVVVRVITDGEQEEASGSQVGRFRSQGIQVRKNSSSYFMHHKFAVVDGKTLINGSLNWTRQGITGNHENILITEQVDIIKSYEEEFEHLWNSFDPKM